MQKTKRNGYTWIGLSNKNMTKEKKGNMWDCLGVFLTVLLLTTLPFLKWDYKLNTHLVVSNNFVGLVIPLKKCSDEKWAFSEEMHIEKIHFWNEKTDEKLKWKIVIIIFFFFNRPHFWFL